MTEASPAVETAGVSHVGRVRRVNEDAWIARPELGLWAVADGMGGHSRGDAASRMVVDALAALPAPAATDPRALLRSVEDALAGVNRELARAPHTADGAVSGTTVAVLLLHGRHYAVLWAGDSRVYRMAHGGALEPLTRDHSLVQELIDRGELAPEAARGHPLSNRITRALGVDEELVLEGAQGMVDGGDVFLLCSDGLTHHIDEAELRDTLATGAPPTDAATRLVETALARGAEDDVTAVIARTTADEPPQWPDSFAADTP